MVRYETPIPSVDGVEIVHTPVFKTEDYSPEAMAKCVYYSAQILREAFIDASRLWRTDASSSMRVARPRYASVDPILATY